MLILIKNYLYNLEVSQANFYDACRFFTFVTAKFLDSLGRLFEHNNIVTKFSTSVYELNSIFYGSIQVNKKFQSVYDQKYNSWWIASKVLKHIGIRRPWPYNFL